MPTTTSSRYFVGRTTATSIHVEPEQCSEKEDFEGTSWMHGSTIRKLHELHAVVDWNKATKQ
jgi:hypothetical protein